MKPSAAASESHLDEGALVRYLDEEMTVAERAAAAAHLLGCAECAAQLDGLRTDRQLLADVLGQFAVPSMDTARRDQSWERIERAAARRRSSRRVIGLRAAAIGATVVVSAFSVSPVRALALDLWSRVTEAADRIVTRTIVVESPPITLSGVRIGLVPKGDSFVLEVRSRQEAGSLALSLIDGGSVNASDVGGNGSVEIVILQESGIRIENEANDTNSYAVGLPKSLREIRIRIADEPDLVYAVDSLMESWISVIDLTPEVASTVEPTP